MGDFEKTKEIARGLSRRLQAAPLDDQDRVLAEELAKVPQSHRDMVEHIVAASLVYGTRTGEFNAEMANDKTLLWIGVAFLLLSLAIAVFIPAPSNFQLFVFRTFVALAAGAFAAFVPGMFQIRLGKWVKGGGALGVFLLVYAVNPATFIQTPVS